MSRIAPTNRARQSKRKPLYFVFHKPYKVLSQFSSEDGHAGLGSFLDVPKDVYPVGRLDLDSEGLLILTNDTQLNARLLNPSHGHWRTYWVEVEGQVEDAAIKKLESGVEINLKGKVYKTQRAKVRVIQPEVAEREPAVNYAKHPVRSWLEISLTEGKNRQVRRMTAKVGHPTLRLVRVSIEDLHIGTLKAGEMVQLSQPTIHKKLKLL